MHTALIIFAKNPVLGQVKTRLAKSIGDDSSLEVYKKLLLITAHICESIQEIMDLHIFYSDHIEHNDIWSELQSTRHVQSSVDDLGIRMKAAFAKLFDRGYQSAIIIGTDCPYLSAEHLITSCKELENNDVVIGPSQDGGFYLLGVHNMKTLIFDDIIWSTNTVFENYMSNLGQNMESIYTLPILEDIDDLPQYERFKFTSKFLNCNNL